VLLLVFGVGLGVCCGVFDSVVDGFFFCLGEVCFLVCGVRCGGGGVLWGLLLGFLVFFIFFFWGVFWCWVVLVVGGFVLLFMVVVFVGFGNE